MKKNKSMNVKSLNTFALLLAIIFYVSALLPAAAAAQDEELTIDQVSVSMPEVTVYFSATDDISSDLNVDATLGGEALAFNSVQPFADSGEGIWYIFAIDISGSMTTGQMRGIRNAIDDIADEMGVNDRVTIISFGLEVDVPVNLSSDADEIKAAAQALEANQGGTLFYDAIVRGLELGAQYDETTPTRRTLMVFSDAEDYNIGGYVDWEVERRLLASEMPMHAFGFLNVAREHLDNFGAMARLSGGGIYVVTDADVQETVAEHVQGIKNGYVASFNADSNIVSGETEKLTLHVASNEQFFRAERDIIPTRWIRDNTAPEIISTEQSGPSTIQIVFSESVSGAGSVESYRIENTRGDLAGLRAVSYDSSEHTATLTIDETVRSDTLEITFPGITDASMEKNALSESVSLEYTGAPEPTPTPTPDPVIIVEQVEGEGIDPAVWIVGSIVIAAIVAGIILGVIKSRGGLVRVDGKLRFAGQEEIVEVTDDSEAVKYKFVTSKAPEINLRVIDGSGKAKDIVVAVPGSAFVGRAEGNDLVFDDNRMSRQHFCIVSEESGFQLMNLSDTAGTLLNGIPLNGQRPLRQGDKIEAGSITFVVL